MSELLFYFDGLIQLMLLLVTYGALCYVSIIIVYCIGELLLKLVLKENEHER